MNARGAVGGAVVRSLVLLVVGVRPFVSVGGARGVLRERGGVVGFGE